MNLNSIPSHTSAARATVASLLIVTAWSRIVLFMQAGGKYLLHGRLARPSDLTHRRRHPDERTRT
ncbi:hypothetical protein AAGS40_30360 (plasmid) [Paraburkholderia sp. PREW-6R]|uniref:hypothetical protein n=1 Tax=Paraburkholderia sp. PREW-6R TaxID=3141544 RepID=UPI0031F55D6E